MAFTVGRCERRLVKNTLKPRIYKIHNVGTGRLLAMAKPTPGEFIEDEISGIAQEGICVVVSLLEKNEEYSVGLAREEELCEKNGMEFISYPIPDMGLPRSLQTYRDITKNIFDKISNGASVVVHCRAGIGRTGIVTAGVLLHSGMQVEEALEVVSKGRGIQVPDTDEQREWVEQNYKEIISGS